AKAGVEVLLRGAQPGVLPPLHATARYGGAPGPAPADPPSALGTRGAVGAAARVARPGARARRPLRPARHGGARHARRHRREAGPHGSRRRPRPAAHPRRRRGGQLTGALFVMPRSPREWTDVAALWVTVAGWADAARRGLGAAWVVTPDGITTPDGVLA